MAAETVLTSLLRKVSCAKLRFVSNARCHGWTYGWTLARNRAAHFNHYLITHAHTRNTQLKFCAAMTKRNEAFKPVVFNQGVAASLGVGSLFSRGRKRF